MVHVQRGIANWGARYIHSIAGVLDDLVARAKEMGEIDKHGDELAGEHLVRPSDEPAHVRLVACVRIRTERSFLDRCGIVRPIVETEMVAVVGGEAEIALPATRSAARGLKGRRQVCRVVELGLVEPLAHLLHLPMCDGVAAIACGWAGAAEAVGIARIERTGRRDAGLIAGGVGHWTSAALQAPQSEGRLGHGA